MQGLEEGKAIPALAATRLKKHYNKFVCFFFSSGNWLTLFFFLLGRKSNTNFYYFWSIQSSPLGMFQLFLLSWGEKNKNRRLFPGCKVSTLYSSLLGQKLPERESPSQFSWGWVSWFQTAQVNKPLPYRQQLSCYYIPWMTPANSIGFVIPCAFVLPFPKQDLQHISWVKVLQTWEWGDSRPLLGLLIG